MKLKRVCQQYFEHGCLQILLPNLSCRLPIRIFGSRGLVE